MIGFIGTYTFTQFSTIGNYTAIAIPHTLQFTVLHALGFSVFTSRILATDFSQSHCNFKHHCNYSTCVVFDSHTKSSWNSLIPFLPFPTATNPEDSTQSSSDYCSVLLQLLNSQFQSSNLCCSFKLAYLYRHSTDLQKNTCHVTVCMARTA
jgi:hypothetical protein